MNFAVIATEEQVKKFIEWCWEWYSLDEIGKDDPYFRTMAMITWQLQDQLPDEEKK